jgi:protein involved in polysaccharide export with SLBB domain
MSMRRRHLTAIAGLSAIAVLSVSAWSAGMPAQEKKPREPTNTTDAAKAVPPGVLPPPVGAEKIEAAIDKMIAEYDLKPQPLQPVPDDPPPHEGAMVSLPYVVEPPDLIMVEVLEALPGRPISGERLVRPDGKITLGFYGDVYVKGLTLPQVKVAVIKQLRAALDDDMLGLMVLFQEPENEGTEMQKIPPKLPEGKPSSPDAKEKAKARPSAYRFQSRRPSAKPRPTSRRAAGGSLPIRRVGAQAKPEADQTKAAPPPAPGQLIVPLGDQGEVKITTQVGRGNLPAVEPAQVNPFVPQGEPAVPVPAEQWRVVPPAESPTVLIDVTAYNTKNYYVLGDVQLIGKLPYTGHETVLDAIQLAGGLMPSADPGNIRLVRPARGGKPARVYKVDLAAIQERGDVRSNYQIFPGDRLIVGRNATVQKTAELDRLAAPINVITGSILYEAFALRSLQFANPDNPEKLLKELVEFWAKRAGQGGDFTFDEKTLREILMRRLAPLPPAAATPAAK